MADRPKRLDRTIKRVGRSGGLQLSEFESGSGRKVPPYKDFAKSPRF